MDSTVLHDLLDSDRPVEEKKAALKSYLEACARDAMTSGENDQMSIAYGIAGLLATKFGKELPQNDPYLKILEIAGDLELPEAHRSPGVPSWTEFTALIQALE